MIPTTIHLRLLGGFAVTVDGTDLELQWPTRRSAELVQLLALAPRHRLLRDQVIDALWPHLDAAAGGANLRKAAHFARATLSDPSAVELRQQTVTLFPDAVVMTDVEDFERAADAAISADDPELARAAAVGYSGDLLPDARYEPWAEEQRRLLRDRYLDLLRRSSQWELLLEADPLDEVACRNAMRRAVEDGHRHRAISYYGRLRSGLLHELGVLPEPETEHLYLELLGGARPSEVAFVGRAAELAIIDARLADPDSTMTLALVRGPGGIGKTAFTREIARRSQARGWQVATVTATDRSDAYAALASLVEQLLAADRAVSAEIGDKTRAVLATLTPALRPADPLETPLTRHQVVGAVQRLLTAAAGGTGVVIIVDDADLADRTSLATLACLGDRHPCPILLVLAHRPEATTDELRRAVTRASLTQPPVPIDLGSLSAAELRELTAPVSSELTGAQLETLVARSEGNPFFALELARAGAPALGSQLGPDLRDAITHRFVDLTDDVVAWLRRLALVGGQLDLPHVLALAACDETDAGRLLDEALAAGVMVVDDGAYRFRHDLVRAALAEQLAPHQRVAVHRDAARRLADLGARPGVIAGHWLAGGRPERAVEWSLRAADEAIRLSGFAAAVEHLDSVLAHDPDHVEALRRRAEALDALGDPRAVAAYAAAARVASPEEQHEILPLQALAQIKLGDPEGALITVADARPRQLESQLARALTYSGAAALGVADPEQGTLLAAEGRRLAIESGDPSAIVVASWAQAAAAHARGELRLTLRTDLMDTYALPRLAVSVFDGQLCITQRLLYGARPYDDVISFLGAFADEATRLGATRGVAFATTLRGEAELLAGRLEDAERDLIHGRDLHRDMHAATGEAFSLQRLAELAFQRGDRVLARRLLDDALAVARESDVGFHLLDRIYGTRIVLAGDDPGAALAAVEEAEESVCGPLETCPGCRITLAVPAAIAAATAGDLERLETYERSCEWLADVVMRLPAWYAALEEVRGHRCLAHGNAAAARVHLTAAADGFAAAGQPYDRDRCARNAALLADRR